MIAVIAVVGIAVIAVVGFAVIAVVGIAVIAVVGIAVIAVVGIAVIAVVGIAVIAVVAVIVAVLTTVLAALGATHLGHFGDEAYVDAVVVIEHLHRDIKVVEIIVGTYDGRRERETRQYQYCDKYVEMSHGPTPSIFAGHPIRP